MDLRLPLSVDVHPLVGDPRGGYYRWNLILLPPSMFAAWLLASAVVQIASRPLGGVGRFADTVAALGFACSAAHWTLLPHAMNQPTVARTLLWTFLALYVLAFPARAALSRAARPAP